jgi:superfamily II DNA/RNA helicase
MWFYLSLFLFFISIVGITPIEIVHDKGFIFAGVKFKPPLSTSLQAMGLTNPTPIQRAAIAPLTSGLSAILHAETGSGKTLAYLLPLLKRICGDSEGNDLSPLQAFIIVPTKELAVQVAADITSLTSLFPTEKPLVHVCISSKPRLYILNL